MISVSLPTLHKFPPYQKRQFVPDVINLKDPQAIKDLYKKLEDRLIHSNAFLEQWLSDRSELESAISQEGSILYIRMTCDTTDSQSLKEYKEFIETIPPVIKPLEHRLNQKFIEAYDRFPWDEKYYGIYLRKIKSELSLFREENVPLQTKIDLLAQEYQTICGTMTVKFEGREYTLPQMSKFLLEPKRELRECAWRKIAARRLQDKEKLDELFNKMLILRHQIAQNAGFPNYRDYRFKALHRFDYTPEDCKRYHDTIEKVVVPLWRDILKRRAGLMKLSFLRPWDTSVDPQGWAPLKPFNEIRELMEGSKHIFYKMDQGLGEKFEEMLRLGLLDLESRKGKAPGGYNSTLDEVRKPFIFMNAVGIDSDVRTLMHEAGHAFHSFLTAPLKLLDYRHGPMEFNEVASMGMELLAGEYIDEFYSQEDAKRSKQEHLKDIIFTLIWVATIDCFQHWIYENPFHTVEERKKAWLSIRKRFEADIIDWKDLEEEHSFLWHRQLHIFEVPFYYIEYGIAQLGALQLWFNAKKNWPQAMSDYKRGLSIGGSRELPEIYKTTGIRFDFSVNTIAPLMQAIKKELEEI